MKRILRAGAVIFLSAVLLCSISGCGAKSDQVDEATMARLGELVQDFANELEAYIIPARDDTEKLTKLGMTVSTQTATYNIDPVLSFYEEYENRKNTSVTFAFSTTSFVVTRVVIEGDFGYYMRYQYDPKSEKLPISSKLVDSVSLTEDSELGKVELTLRRQKANLATFAFRNLDLPKDEEAS